MRALLVSLALTALLAGCFGAPEGTIDYGDQVSLTVSIEGLRSGTTLLPPVPAADVIIVPGNDPFFPGTSRALHGAGTGDTVDVRLTPTPDYEEVRANVTLSPVQARSEVSAQSLTQGGLPAQQVAGLKVGDRIFWADYGREVKQINQPTVNTTTYVLEVVLDDPNFPGTVQERQFQLAGRVVSSRAGDMIVRSVEPTPNGLFIVQGGFLAPVHPLGLEPGVYRHKAIEGDQLVLARLNQDNLATLFDTPVLVKFTIGSITHNTDPYQRPLVENDNYGFRFSPHIAS